jgi:ArsR family transcriptional regulator
MMTMEEAQIRSSIIKAMGHPVRLMMIERLKEREHSFSEICSFFNLDKSTVSKHLFVLKESGIVTSQKTGTDMIYRLEVPCLTDFFGCVTAVFEKNVRRQRACLGEE